VKIKQMRLLRKLYLLSGGWLGARYIYKELIFPFLFSIAVVTFVLLANFMIKSVDRLLGKNLPASVIFEFIYLNLAWIIAMSVPMAVLIACLMAYGRLAEDNEITAMRSSGISFMSILTPGIMFGLVVAVFMVYFHNDVLPDYNHRARLLAGDIYRKSPGINLEPGYFVDDLPEYSIYVHEKQGELLQKITIYSKDNAKMQTTIYADSGYVSVLGNSVFFTLYRGEIHELNLDKLEEYRRLNFKKHVISIPVDNLILERRDSARRGDREMTILMMKEQVQRYTDERNRVDSSIMEMLHKEFSSEMPVEYKQLAKAVEALKEANLTNESSTEAAMHNRRLDAITTRIRSEMNLRDSYQKQINRYQVEIHKKISIPFACIVFVLMGAPLGVMTRRGGIAIAAILSLIFFLLYYIFLIGGEELADVAIIPPFWAMWTPNIVLSLVGIYLIYYATWEQRVIRWMGLTKLLRSQSPTDSEGSIEATEDL
jgi:lipopolysaccharide export system permease protein